MKECEWVKMRDGDVEICVDGGIHLKCVTRTSGDPVELECQEVEELIAHLRAAVAVLEKD